MDHTLHIFHKSKTKYQTLQTEDEMLVDDQSMMRLGHFSLAALPCGYFSVLYDTQEKGEPQSTIETM
ncbi:hypothetical protein RRG08_056894 [Elysia crispata]|uniref:Uncharacterized protein n=1 Tax=Elysia crispata TaxID=231223 RepID=A0AAE0ZDM9_9GAST|nr:hypothetical protein RRG08_056894 [Elysia crispata]